MFCPPWLQTPRTSWPTHVVHERTGEMNFPFLQWVLDVATHVVDKTWLDWEVGTAEAQYLSKLDNHFLTNLAPAQPLKLLPVFLDLHQEVSRSWKQQKPESDKLALTNTWRLLKVNIYILFLLNFKKIWDPDKVFLFDFLINKMIKE